MDEEFINSCSKKEKKMYFFVAIEKDQIYCIGNDVEIELLTLTVSVKEYYHKREIKCGIVSRIVSKENVFCKCKKELLI